MNIFYKENEKRHIFESETGHMSTFLKERVTKEQAEALFLAQLANAGITSNTVAEAPAPETPVTEPDTTPEPPVEPAAPVEETPVTPEPDTTPAPPVEPPVEPAPEDVTPTDTTNA